MSSKIVQRNIFFICPKIGINNLPICIKAEKLIQTVSAQHHSIFFTSFFRRGSGIRTHDPQFPKLVR